MKRFFLILAAIAALVSCSKEGVAEEDATLTPKEGDDVHELFVSIADLTDADTKATISSADGSFTWTSGDQIAVKTTTNDVYCFTASGNGNSVRFTYTGSMNGTPKEVKFPYTADFSDTALPTEITGLDGGLGATGIRMEGTVVSNAVTMHHTNALLKVSFTNVPTFANKIVFDGDVNDVTITFTPLVSKGTISAYIPVDESTTAFTVSLIDNSTDENTIFQKSTTSKSFTAGTIKNMAPLTVGHIITINRGTWDYTYLQIWNGTYNGTNSYEFRLATSGGEYPYRLNVLSSTVYYVVIDPSIHLNKSSAVWISEGLDIGVSFQKTSGSAEYRSYTNCVYLCRDIEFTPMANGEGGLKTKYRVYYDNSSTKWSSIKAYAWGDTGIYVRWYNWSDRRVYYRATDKTSWGWGTPTAGNYRKVYGQGDTYAFYEVDESFWNKSIEYLGIGVDGSASEITDSGQKDLSKSQFFYKSDVAYGHDKTEPTKKEVLSTADWPGDVISADNGRYYFEFGLDQYGYGYNIVFSDASNSSNKTYDSHMMINREYTLPL